MRKKILILVLCTALFVGAVIGFIMIRENGKRLNEDTSSETQQATEERQGRVQIKQLTDIIANPNQEIDVTAHFTIVADEEIKNIKMIHNQKEVAFDTKLQYAETGFYSNKIVVTDQKGHEESKIFTVRIVNEPTFTGVEDISLKQENKEGLETFLTAIRVTDEVDGDLTANMETNASEINMNVPGQYTFSGKVTTSYGKVCEKTCVITVQEPERQVPENEKSTQAAEPVAPDQTDWVASLQVAQSALQLLVVSASGTSATVSLHNRDDNGIWSEAISTSGFVGQEGVGKGSEYSKTTPKGIYGFSMAFGIKGNPGSRIPYTQVDDDDYWVDDVDSPYYNQFVSTNSVSADSWNSAEHLSRCAPAYNYALAINYNSTCVPGAGSAIFLHCSTGEPTYGCISVPENVMISLLQNINSGCTVLIDNASNINNN